MMNYMECSVCGQKLDADTEIYIRTGEYLGCENCVEISYPSVREENTEEFVQDKYEGVIWEISREKNAGVR